MLCLRLHWKYIRDQRIDAIQHVWEFSFWISESNVAYALKALLQRQRSNSKSGRWDPLPSVFLMFWDFTCKIMFKMLMIPMIISCFCCSTRQHSNCPCYCERLEITFLLHSKSSALESKDWNHDKDGLKVVYHKTHTLVLLHAQILEFPESKIQQNSIVFMVTDKKSSNNLNELMILMFSCSN